MITPAQRLDTVKEYYFSVKLREVARLNAEGKNIISLAIGSPDMPPSQATIDTLCQEAQRPDAHGYQPTRGIAELRQGMAQFYQRWFGVTLSPETEIQPLIGSKEGILHITLAFANPGDIVLVPNPGYPTYTSLSRLLGCEVMYYDLDAENDWQPDFEVLEQMPLERVKILWTCYPHMPTGAAAQRKTFERLVEFAKKHDILVVNDNPYGLILNDEHLSLLQVDGAKDCCIELNSMSKSHNMPGWRVGMLATNEEFVKWILKVKSNIDSGTFRPLQLAAAKAYMNDDAWHQQANMQTYAERRAIAEEIMQALGCTYDAKTVGMFLWGKIPDTCESGEALADKVLYQARTFITPGFIFGSAGERYIRISLCQKPHLMREALERIKAVF